MKDTTEFRTFLCLCKEEDADMISGKKPLAFDDFRRLGYLMMKLNFLDTFYDFFMEHHDQFIENLEADLSMENISQTDHLAAADEAARWCEEFAAQLPKQQQQIYSSLLGV